MKNPDLQNPTDYSPPDAPWDAHRSVSDDGGGIYLLAAESERYGARMALSGGLLRFGWSTPKETGETRLRLREAHFCRVRHCPVCQWRRSPMWQARFYQTQPRTVAEYPDPRWMFLPPTVRNRAIGELGERLHWVNAAFLRKSARKELRPV
ncbi:protein rep, partial [Escherichia coli]|uniref:protein rep n=1 Tax=Escherichia coli TaxID=562 RepID=UPI00397BFF99